MALGDGGVPATGTSTDTPAVEEVATATLKLVVQPPVEVLREGKVLGKTPLTVSLPLGEHTLELRNPAKGVRTTTRTVTVKPKGTKETIRLAKATVVVKAPKGALLFVDGRKSGTGPKKQLSLFEGEHQLRVTRGKDTWEKSFRLEPKQKLTLTAEFESP